MVFKKGQIPWNLGKSFSEETLQKMSNAKKGKPSWNKGLKNVMGPNKTSFKKGHVSWHKNRKDVYSKNTLLKMSSVKKGKIGKESNNWQGGVTPLYNLIRNCDEYSNWRTQIFGRDNFTCQHCCIRGTWLEAHHIKRFSLIVKENNINTLEEALLCDALWNLDNGITLCKHCHNKIKRK